MNIRRIFAIVAACLIPTTLAAQQVVPPEIPPLRPVQEMGLIWDMAHTNSFNRSVQTTMENGVKKIRATENNLKAYIEEDPANGITMKITRRYGPDDTEALVDAHPELSMYLQAIPTEVGDLEIELTIGVTMRYEAVDIEDLKERHPEAFEVYEKFTSPQTGVRDLRGQFRAVPQILVPAIPPEMRIQIDPRGVRVHGADDHDESAENAQKTSDGKKAADKKKDKDN